MSIYIDPLASVSTEKIGDGTKIWQYVIVLKEATIGSNCNINSHCFIESDVTIGNNVTIKCGVYLWNGVKISDNVFIGPNVTFTNDIFPRSKHYPEKFLETLILEGASVGAGAVLLSGITIGKNSLIGAGSVVTKDVPENALVYGNPARQHGFVTDKK